MQASLLEILHEIPDHSRREGKRFDLSTVLLYAILAMVAGPNSYPQMHEFIRTHLQRLNEVFGLELPSPSYTGLRLILQGVHLRDLYGVDFSPDLIGAVTDAVLDEVGAWRARPLEPVYPLVFFDALCVKIRDEGLVRNKAVQLALGVRADGTEEILGLWLEQNEGAKFWPRVMNEMKTRSVEDILIAVVDGLKGFPEAIVAVFPERRFRPASSIFSATAWTLSPTRTARPWRRRSRASIARGTPPMAKPPWRPSRLTSIARTASATYGPCEINTLACRNFATISSRL